VRIEKVGWVPTVRDVPGDTAVLLEVDLKPVVRPKPRPKGAPEISDPFR
jgi:hypothetical protein